MSSEPNRGRRRLSRVYLIAAADEPHPEPRAHVRSLRLAPASTFEQFFARHRNPIARALALTLRDADLAGEAVDEAMARAYERWDHVGSIDNPAGWVYRVALNWSRSFLRRATRRTPAWLGSPNSVVDDTGIDPAVDRALGELSVDQRAVVVCRLLIGMSEAETAAALDLAPGTVKSRLSRATARLQRSLSHLPR